jgi:RNAse (barnase) inhibitor barstar
MESKILTYLGVSSAESEKFGDKTKKFVKVLDGLQQVYAQSPDNTKKEKLAIAIVQMNRDLMAYLKANKLGVYKGSTQPEQQQPEQPQQPQPQQPQRALLLSSYNGSAIEYQFWDQRGSGNINTDNFYVKLPKDILFNSEDEFIDWFNKNVAIVKDYTKKSDFKWDYYYDNVSVSIKINMVFDKNKNNYLYADEEDYRKYRNREIKLYEVEYTFKLFYRGQITQPQPEQPQPEQPQPEQPQPEQPQPEQPQPEQPQPEQPRQKTKAEKVAELKVVITGLKILARKNGDPEGKIKSTLTGLEILLRNLQR